MTSQEAIAELHALGYFCVEAEIKPTWVGLLVWKKYARLDGFGVSAATLDEALRVAVTRAKDLEEDQKPKVKVKTCQWCGSPVEPDPWSCPVSGRKCRAA